MMAHEKKRLVPGPVLKKVDRQVGDNVGGITLELLPLPHFDEVGVVIDALPGQNVPVIKTGRIARQMPFADHARVITGRLQHLRHRRLTAIEAVKDCDAVDVAVFAGQNAGAARSANRVHAKTIEEAHSFIGEAIEIGRLVDAAAVTTHRVRCVIVGHDKEDVRASRSRFVCGEGWPARQR